VSKTRSLEACNMLNLRYSVLATNRLDVFSSTKQRESQS